MDPLSIAVITGLVAVGVGAFGKILYHLRHNIKSCWGITFKSRTNSPNQSQINEQQINLEAIINDAHQQNQIIANQNVNVNDRHFDNVQRERLESFHHGDYIFPRRGIEC